ncbi:MAG TPA: diacylglycerol kinase family protein [Ktedonobacterales bacterium]|nr:diacylglycerol kinase family protein [Ktedonobacterales bacterium]
MYARIIANLHSGGGHSSQDDLRQLVRSKKQLQQRGWRVEICHTDGPGNASRLAAQAVAAGVDIVISAGGDGTLNEVIQGLAGTDVALGVLPMGTMNVWAREVGIPLNAEGAAEVLLDGEQRRIDLGTANGRYFLLFAGIGADGKITSMIENHFLKRLGLFSYILAGAVVGLGPLDYHMRLRLDDRRFRTRASLIIIGNTRLYGGLMTFTNQAYGDDGLLDMCLVRRQGVWGRLRVLLNALRRHYPLGARVSYERFRTLTIDSSVPVPIEVDGEPAGTLPAVFRVAPKMLTVIVPRGTKAGLFRKLEASAAS